MGEAKQETRLDPLTPIERSERMGRVRRNDTKPERTVRRVLTRLGYRYRLQYKKLPGCPDIAFPGRRKVIWVHGCFWHRHTGCALARIPKTRVGFWLKKLEGNRVRDKRHQMEIARLGWEYIIVWECELRDFDSLASKLEGFLEAQ